MDLTIPDALWSRIVQNNAAQNGSDQEPEAFALDILQQAVEQEEDELVDLGDA